MLHIQKVTAPGGGVSELMLSDRLIALAEDAERAGFRRIAAQLVRLACDVFDEAAGRGLNREAAAGAGFGPE